MRIFRKSFEDYPFDRGLDTRVPAPQVVLVVVCCDGDEVLQPAFPQMDNVL